MTSLPTVSISRSSTVIEDNKKSNALLPHSDIQLLKPGFSFSTFNPQAFIRDFIFGGTSAAISKTGSAPLERVKLILQVQDSKDSARGHGRVNGIRDCFTRVVREQGVLSLWRGNYANVLRSFPNQALNFALNDQLKRVFIAGIDHRTQFWRYFAGDLVSGSTAGAISLILLYPLDFARTRLAADMGGVGLAAMHKREFTGITDCILKVWRADGMSGVYRGFNASVTCVLIYRGAYFGLHDVFKRRLFADSHRVNFFVNWALAQTATVCAGVFAYPFDTVRRRLMMQSGRDAGAVRYRGTLHCWRLMFREEGIRGLYRGTVANLMRSAGSALILALYDELQYYFAPAAGHHRH